MGAAIGDVFGLAAGVAGRPPADRGHHPDAGHPAGRTNGVLFAVGWLAGLAVLGRGVLLLAGPADASTDGRAGRLDRLVPVSLAAHLPLQRIAETTGARFLAAPSSRDLKGVYDELGSRIGFVKQSQEVTVVFAAAGLLLTVAGAAVSLAWFKRLP
jgi:hypothetical protein